MICAMASLPQTAAQDEGGQLGGFLKASNIFSALYLIFALLVIIMGPSLGRLILPIALESAAAVPSEVTDLGGVCGGVFSWAAGALTDFTRHRKTLLSCLFLVMNVSCLLLLVVGSTPDAWIGVSALLVLTLLAAELVGVPILAYLPEVTSDHARSTAVTSASTIIFVIVCLCFTGAALAAGATVTKCHGPRTDRTTDRHGVWVFGQDPSCT